MSKSGSSKSESNLDSNGRSKLTKKLIYLTAFITVCLTGLGQIPPNPWGGFYCHDLSIQVQRKIDTMSTVWLFVLLLLPSIVVMYLTEKLAATDTEAKANGSSESSSKDSKSVLKRSTSPNREEGPWKKAKNVYGRYLIGLLLTTCFNEVTKVLIAEPRPHFFQTCNPDMSTGLCAAQNSNFVYYSDVSCQGANDAGYGVPRKVTDSMKSFPSGHAQLSAYSAMFMIFYLQSHSTLSNRTGNGWKLFSGIFFVTFALIASITRVMDRRHHWWDVMAGDIFGISTAVLMKVFSESKIDSRVAR